MTECTSTKNNKAKIFINFYALWGDQRKILGFEPVAHNFWYISYNEQFRLFNFNNSLFNFNVIFI